MLIVTVFWPILWTDHNSLSKVYWTLLKVWSSVLTTVAHVDETKHKWNEKLLDLVIYFSLSKCIFPQGLSTTEYYNNVDSKAKKTNIFCTFIWKKIRKWSEFSKPSLALNYVSCLTQTLIKPRLNLEIPKGKKKQQRNKEYQNFSPKTLKSHKATNLPFWF